MNNISCCWYQKVHTGQFRSSKVRLFSQSLFVVIFFLIIIIFIPNNNKVNTTVFIIWQTRSHTLHRVTHLTPHQNLSEADYYLYSRNRRGNRLRRIKSQDFPWWSSGQDSALAVQGETIRGWGTRSHACVRAGRVCMSQLEDTTCLN